MVTLFLVLFSLLCPSHISAEAPVAEASVDSATAHAHFPLSGTLTITHEKGEAVDSQSFAMEGKPLEVAFVKDSPMSSPGLTIVSIYHFQLPAQEKGLFVLPAISVKVGENLIQSSPSTYEVKGDEEGKINSDATSTTSDSPLIFRLEAEVKGPKSLYPGERTLFVYRILYNQSVDLTRSEFPMIHPDHFQKVGDVQIKDYQLKEITVQELTQEVEASDPGVFQLGPSFIEGHAYSMELGQKVYSPALLRSETAPITIEVKPFPKLQEPLSFTGAIGEISVEAALSSSSTVSVGDTTSVTITIKGAENPETVRFPPIECQPGFSGFFQTSDLPPASTNGENSNTFFVELRPMTTLIQEIPPIELSSFDPKSKKYATKKTPSIPLTVHPLPQKEARAAQPFPVVDKLPNMGSWPAPQAAILELHDPLPPLQIDPPRQGSVDWIKWIFPIGMALLLLQYDMKKRWDRHSNYHRLNSRELLQEALDLKDEPDKSLPLFEKAVWNLLWERNDLPEGDFSLDRKRIPKELFEFLVYLQSLQFSQEKHFNFAEIKAKAIEILDHNSNKK